MMNKNDDAKPGLGSAIGKKNGAARGNDGAAPVKNSATRKDRGASRRNGGVMKGDGSAE